MQETIRKLRRAVLPLVGGLLIALGTSFCNLLPLQRPPSTPTPSGGSGPSTPSPSGPTMTATSTLLPSSPTPVETPTVTPTLPPMALRSSAFESNGRIPKEFTCFGKNQSPPLSWSSPPPGTESFALVMVDLDSVPLGFAHWVVYNIPPTSRVLPVDVPAGGRLDDGTLQGSNDFAPFGAGIFPGGASIKRVGYDGPCPGGSHRHLFLLYALDATLSLPPKANMDEVVASMEGHMLTVAGLVGIYGPNR